MNVIKRVSLFIVGAVIATMYSAGSGAQTLSDALSRGEALELSSGVSGQVAEILVKPGELVQKGQLLLTLDSTSYQSRLDAKLAQQDYANFKLQLLEEDYARQQELYDEGSLSTVDLQQLDLAVKLARSEVASALAAVNMAVKKLAYTKIVAPVDGEITAVPMVGQRVRVDSGLPVLIKMTLR